MFRHYYLPILFFLALIPSLVSACELLEAVEVIVKQQLPAFVLASDKNGVGKDCTAVVKADFNGDRKIDYAAVLMEKVAPRAYGDGSPWLQGYIVVFLASELPYSKFQAIILLGHNSQPDDYRIETKMNKKQETLLVHNAEYSTTEYKWQQYGFVVSKHEAD